MENNKYKYLAKNTLLFTISSFGSKILVFLLVPLYTSILTTSEYGIADLITTSATLLMYVFTINIGDSVLRFAIDQKSEQHKILSYGIRVLLVGSLILVILIATVDIAKIIPWDTYCYFFLFLDFFVISCYQILSNYLRAVDKVKEVAIGGLIITLVTVTLNIFLLLVFRIGLVGYLISVVAGSFAACIYSLIVIGLPLRTLLFDTCSSSTSRDMRRYSVPLIFNGIAWWMNNSLDKYFVTWMCGASENGILSVAYKIPTILTVFHSIFSQAWNLSAIKEFDRDDKDGFFGKTYSTYNAALLITCSVLIILNIPIAKILFAKDFFVAWQYSSILLIAIVFSSLSGILGSVFTAVKDSKIFAVSTVTSALINCALNAVLIHFFGTLGAAIATAISFFCVWLIRLICTRKYIKWKIDLKRDSFAYLLIILQVLCEHLNNHCYFGQIIILILLLLLYRQYISAFLSLIKKLTQKVVR